jgi:hypothetical protein
MPGCVLGDSEGQRRGQRQRQERRAAPDLPSPREDIGAPGDGDLARVAEPSHDLLLGLSAGAGGIRQRVLDVIAQLRQQPFAGRAAAGEPCFNTSEVFGWLHRGSDPRH